MDSHSAESLSADLQLNRVCDEFELAWQAGKSPAIEDYVPRVGQPEQLRLLRELWEIERHHRRRADGQPVDEHALRELHPDLALRLNDSQRTIATAGAAATSRQSATGQASGEAPRGTGLHIRCPHCSSPVELLPDAPVDDVSCNACGSTFSLVDDDGDAREARALEQLGRFELLARLGVGGFGTVWKARDTELDRIVAIKIPRKGNLNTREVEQFLREARAAAQLRHPNIVPVFEVVRERDMLFIVSEYVRGTPLSKWTRDDRHPALEVAKVCAAVTDALDCAHEAGIVHRDLKPSNVMVDLHDQPRLMDFGLAKREIGEVTMTVDGLILGTPAYMSPEQARGEGHWTDRRSDIYSLGVMLFHLLTGELPFRGTGAAQIQARLRSDPPDPRSLDRSVPIDLATISLKCMDYDPNRRYQTAREVGDELRRVLDGFPIRARPISRLTRATKWARRNPAQATALVLGAVLAIGGPTTAVVIEMQRQEIESRLDERETLVSQREGEKRALQRELEQSQARLATLTGTEPTVDVPQWRQELIVSLLDQHLDGYQRQIDTMDNGSQKAELQISVGRLLVSCQRYGAAIEYLTDADQTLVDGGEDDAATALRRADIGLRTSHLLFAAGRLDEASTWLARARDALDRVDQESSVASIHQIDQALLGIAVDPPTPADEQRLHAARDAKLQAADAWPEDIRELPPIVDALLRQ